MLIDALSSLSGLTRSQPNFNVLVESLRNTPYETKTRCKFSEWIFQLLKLSESITILLNPVWWREQLKSINTKFPVDNIQIWSHRQFLLVQKEWMRSRKAYEDVNEMFGDIVKVTPSSKVEPEIWQCLWWITNFQKKTSSKRKSVVSGVCEEYVQRRSWTTVWRLAERITKNNSQRPETIYRSAKCASETNWLWNWIRRVPEKIRRYQSFLDFLSWKFYPKVFEITIISTSSLAMWLLPTPAFFYRGQKSNEEILVNIGRGKTLLIRLLHFRQCRWEWKQNCILPFEWSNTFHWSERTTKLKLRRSHMLKLKAIIILVLHCRSTYEDLLWKRRWSQLKNAPLFTIKQWKWKPPLPHQQISKSRSFIWMRLRWWRMMIWFGKGVKIFNTRTQVHNEIAELSLR